MCGIFGKISESVNNKKLCQLGFHSIRRGRDASGLVFFDPKFGYKILRADYDIKKLINRNKFKFKNSNFIMGHSRLITNGIIDNQPIYKNEVIVLHNGIVINHEALWKTIEDKRKLEVDTEIIAGLTIDYIKKKGDLSFLCDYILNSCKGTVSAAIALPKIGKLFLLSNNGSLYTGFIDNDFYFSSEQYPLSRLGCVDIKQICNHGICVEVPKSNELEIDNLSRNKKNLIPKLNYTLKDNVLEFNSPKFKRCSNCILPDTFPYICFDENNVCNYCKNYKPRNIKSKEDFFDLKKKYEKNGKVDCVVPFSGGRDSCYLLHIIVNEIGIKPIAFTYDWGMVTDLARRNISRICSKLGVENIIISADIIKKRKNIKNNLEAWLNKPHLGMVGILTAGDKQIFRYTEKIKKQNNINLNLWGINHFETTYFKAGFLGIRPDFNEKNVYSCGFLKQAKYQFQRLKAMIDNPGYFNFSLFDTLLGEYYRSIAKRSDCYNLYDYYPWEEKKVNSTLDCYEFEKAFETNTTWRIGDATAAFYNYIYNTVAGFTENDTFRSNQIREGHISREEALKFIIDENRPQYQNIKWYLDVLDVDFKDAIYTINKIPKLYQFN